MKKILCVVLSILLLGALLAGCGGKQSPSGAKDGKTVSVNGTQIALDKTDTYEEKISYTVSSDFHRKYSTLAGMIYYVPGPDGDTPNSLNNVLRLTVCTKPYGTLEKSLNNLNTEPETFSDVTVEERAFGETVWTFASFVKHVEDPDTGEKKDLLFHQYLLERDFGGNTELVEISILPADDTAAFETELMNSVTFLR